MAAAALGELTGLFPMNLLKLNGLSKMPDALTDP